MTILAVRYGSPWVCVWNVTENIATDELERGIITGVLYAEKNNDWVQVTREELGRFYHNTVSNSSQPFLTFRPSADLPFPT